MLAPVQLPTLLLAQPAPHAGFVVLQRPRPALPLDRAEHAVSDRLGDTQLVVPLWLEHGGINVSAAAAWVLLDEAQQGGHRALLDLLPTLAAWRWSWPTFSLAAVVWCWSQLIATCDHLIVSETADEAFIRGKTAGDIAARLAGHDKHFEMINGSLSSLDARAATQATTLDRLARLAEQEAQARIARQAKQPTLLQLTGMVVAMLVGFSGLTAWFVTLIR
jgi:hypothetical protein